MADPEQVVKRYRGRHVFEKLAARKFEGNIGSPFTGNTFYVDGISGSDGNNGRYASNPLATFNAAIAKCTAGNDDYILAIDCWGADEATIELDITNVHIIGLGSPYATWACLNAGDYHVFTVQSTGNNGEIAGFNIGGGSAYAGIYLADSYAMWIHNCTFGHAYAGDSCRILKGQE